MSAEAIGYVPADVREAAAGTGDRKDHPTAIGTLGRHIHTLPTLFALQFKAHSLPPIPDVDPAYFLSEADHIDAEEISPHPVPHPNDWAPYPNPALGKNIV